MAVTQHPIAPVADPAWLTPDERSMLEVVCEALLPSVAPPAGVSDPHGVFARSARELDVASAVAETLGQATPEERADFKKLLSTMRSPVFGLLTIGRPQGFLKMTAPTRERALRAMANNRMAQLRQGFQAVKRLAGFVFFGAPVAERTNPAWPALDYTAPPSPPTLEAFPKRLQTLPVRGDQTLTADVVIVGSGTGGGRLAAMLAEAGKDVLVVEKGGYNSEPDFSGLEAEMLPQLFLRRGTLATKDLSMVVLGGSTLGGGTVVNWSTSLRTPPDVLAEWEREHGITGATSPDYLKGFEAAEQRVHITTDDSEPNRNNGVLRDGLQALGYEWKPIPRNAYDCQQRCGACGYGCPFGRKQSTMITYLQDASEKGARMLVGCDVRRVTMANGAVTGIEGWAADSETGERRSVTVRAPRVIVAGGAVESPALLLRSGLRNPNIGQHLRLHPVAVVAGQYAEPIHAWEGSLQTVYSRQFANLTGNYGIWFEVAPAHPGLLSLATPWDGGQAFKTEMLRAPHLAAMIVLARDTGEGSVTLDRYGDPVLDYFPNATDQRHLIRGMRELVKVAMAGGAVGATTLHSPTLRFEADNLKPGGYTEKRLSAHLDEITARGLRPNAPMLFSAHQMGTARMGGSAKTAVTDPYGKVWGVRGLYVGDGSLLPTAPGVNPMLSIYGAAYRVGQAILAEG